MNIVRERLRYNMYYFLSKFYRISLENGWVEKAKWYRDAITIESPEISKFFNFDYKYSEKEKVNQDKNSYLIDLIIPVYNSLDELKSCVTSIKKYTDMNKVRVVFVNDASNFKTTDYLRKCFVTSKNVLLVENHNNLGYTYSINRGLKLAKSKNIVTLNSDTVVTENWLEKLILVIESDVNIGIVGPLSNAATWQSIPKLKDDNNDFVVNKLPKNHTVDSMQELLNNYSLNLFSSVELLNGFCMMIKREVLEKIGYMDEVSFPFGYGEEIDYCIRAKQAGFKLVVADDVYIYHSKSKSFGNKKRKELSMQGERAIKQKHGEKLYMKIKSNMNNNHELFQIRENIQKYLDISKEKVG